MKTAAKPTMKDSYFGVNTYYLEGASKKKVPTTKLTIQVDKEIGMNGKTLATLTTSIEAFAKANGVGADTVKFISSWRDLYMMCRRPETDAEFGARVKEAEDFNKAVDAFRADRQKVRDWQAAEQKQRDEKAEALREAMTARASKQLVDEIKAELRSNAKFMGVLADEVLSDEKFVRGLKAVFTTTMKS